jgi:hypothetical protein
MAITVSLASAEAVQSSSVGLVRLPQLPSFVLLLSQSAHLTGRLDTPVQGDPSSS